MIKKYIGIPFSDVEQPSLDGANCITLCELFYKNELDLKFPTIRIHSSSIKHSFMEYLKQINDNFIQLQEPEEYCIIAMRKDIRHPKMVQHFGLYIGNGKILHTLENVGSHIVSLKEMEYYIAGYYQLKSLDKDN